MTNASFSCLVLLLVTSFSLVCCNLCPQLLKGKCQCFEMEEEVTPGIRQTGFRVECSNTTGAELHDDVNMIYSLYHKNRTIYSLQVRDSKLEGMYGLPAGLVDLRHLTLDNTGIDLEQIRESSEVLLSMKSLRVNREKFTEIPENFFTELHGLNVLGLNNVGIAAISEDGFRFIEDSLKELSLRENNLRSIPLAVASLGFLETIDLTGNDIQHVPDDLSRKLEYGLKSLNRLIMNKINCTCQFGKTEFVSWIRSHAIKGVTCHHPQHLFGRDISTTPPEDFCDFSFHYKSAAPKVTSTLFFVTFSTFLIAVYFHN